MQWIYDTHIHLSDPEYREDLKDIIQSMNYTNTKTCCVSMDQDSSKQTLEISKMSSLILPFIGIHPENAWSDLELMTEMINQNAATISGIGEIGLDPTFCSSESDTKRQRVVFESLLSLAEKHNKPVSIHSRKNIDEVLSIIESYSLSGACLHWFDGNKKQLRKAMNIGLFVSYGPVMVYADDKKSLLAKTDEDKILVETDGPVRFSRCFGSKTAQIEFVPSVIFAASKVLKRSYDETCSLLKNNSEKFLGI